MKCVSLGTFRKKQTFTPTNQTELLTTNSSSVNVPSEFELLNGKFLLMPKNLACIYIRRAKSQMHQS